MKVWAKIILQLRRDWKHNNLREHTDRRIEECCAIYLSLYVLTLNASTTNCINFVSYHWWLNFCIYTCGTVINIPNCTNLFHCPINLIGNIFYYYYIVKDSRQDYFRSTVLHAHTKFLPIFHLTKYWHKIYHNMLSNINW